MDISAQNQLGREATNWLNRGRANLLARLVERYKPAKLGQLEILEIGAGYGQNVSVLAPQGAVDVVEVALAFQERLRQTQGVRDVFTQGLPDLQLDRTYDIICAMDVLEHIEDDRAALDWIYDRLNLNGLFIATVPAYQWMFSDHDRANHHFRRYTRPAFSAVIQTRLHILRASYFNMTLFPLAAGVRALWSTKKWVGNRCDQTKTKQSSQIPGTIDAVFGRVLEREAEAITSGWSFPFGLSVLCVAVRRG